MNRNHDTIRNSFGGNVHSAFACRFARNFSEARAILVCDSRACSVNHEKLPIIYANIRV